MIDSKYSLFKEDFDNTFPSLENSVFVGEFENSYEISKRFIEKWRLALINQEMSDDELNHLFCSLILTKSIEDFSDLGILTSDKKWINHNDQVEEIWIKMWNCRDRINLGLKTFKSNLIDHIDNELIRLENYFEFQFGKGLYSSAGIIKDDSLCTICNKDIRTCFHILGNLYRGKICGIISTKVKLVEISIVESPKDPRCRIWPWNRDENYKFSGNAYYFFSIDDFIYKELNTDHNNVHIDQSG